MSSAVVTAVLIGAVLLAFWVGCWVGDESLDHRDVRDPSISSRVDIELEALRSASRIRDITTAAEQYMDAFIEQRKHESALDVPFTVDDNSDEH